MIKEFCISQGHPKGRKVSAHSKLPSHSREEFPEKEGSYPEETPHLPPAPPEHSSSKFSKPSNPLHKESFWLRLVGCRFRGTLVIIRNLRFNRIGGASWFCDEGQFSMMGERGRNETSQSRRRNPCQAQATASSTKLISSIGPWAGLPLMVSGDRP